MQIGFKYHNCRGFGRLYNYGLKYFNPKHMITDRAEERLRILNYWQKYGLEATQAAFKVKRSSLYGWQKRYHDSGGMLTALNVGKTIRIRKNQREVEPLALKEIRRLRLEVCPNMGKAKVKKYLAVFCRENGLAVYSESKIGRIIRDKRIYHHRQKVYHDGRIKAVKKELKLRKPDEFRTAFPGDLVEVDTVVKFAWGIKRYIVTAVDVHSRYGFAFCYQRHDSASARDFIQKMQTVFPYAIKAIQTDNGSEFHKYFREYLKEQKITHYWNYPGRPYRQGHIEKFNRTIQEEFIDWNEILLDDTNRFNQKLTDWLIWYNTKRFHWGLNLETPVDYLLNNCYVSKMCWTNTFICSSSINVV